MFGTYIGNNKMLISTTWGGKIIASSTDYSLMPDLVTKGFFDVSLTNYLINNIKPGYRLIDAGANIGYFSVLASYLTGHNGKVISYEASPSTFSHLVENLTINLCQNVTPVNKAVYSESCVLDFYVSDNFSGNSSIHEPDKDYLEYFISDNLSNKLEVEAEPLDLIIKSLGYVDIIKVDVEGAEYQTFLGMEEGLKNHLVKQVIFELNKLRMKEEWDLFKQFLNKFRLLYSADFYSINQEGHLYPVSIETLFSQEFVENVVMKLN